MNRLSTILAVLVTALFVFAIGTSLRPTESVEAAFPGLNGQIAFTSDRHDAPARDVYYRICVMNADGSEQTGLTSSRGDDSWPTWSPDGKRIAFASDRDGNWEIFVMEADGSGESNLTNNRHDDMQPSWTP